MRDKSPLGILQVQIAEGQYDALPLYRPTLRLGRSQANDIILNEPRVSGQHAQLSFSHEGWLVVDLDSSNGTMLDGQRLAPRSAKPVQSGSVLQIGGFRLSIREPGPEEVAPPYLGDRVQLNASPGPGLAAFFQGQTIKFPLEKAVLILGRRTDSDLRIPDPQVSGHHARLEQVGTTYQITDLGSTNGLIYQGQRIGKHVLADGDLIAIGQNVVLQYRTLAGFLSAVIRDRVETPQTQYLDMRALPTTDRRITIGRHSSNVLVLEHPRVSRYHAVLEQFGARFRLRDLNSDNGTFVNGQRVEKEAWIKEGDEIRIASHRLVFKEDGITHFDEAGNIRLDALRIEKRYSKATSILKKVSLSIYPKEFVALVGASGAGKSTLMNALTGFNPANGAKSRVLVNGKNLYSHIDEYRSEMGYVPQEDIIHRELSVYKALDYAAQLRMPADTSKEERHRRVIEVINELGLIRQKENPITALSGGQRKRVSMGVELPTKPGLFSWTKPRRGWILAPKLR